jgi:hypothetical protein
MNGQACVPLAPPAAVVNSSDGRRKLRTALCTRWIRALDPRIEATARDAEQTAHGCDWEGRCRACRSCSRPSRNGTAKGHGGLAATGTLRSDAERSLTHAFLVFGRDSSRGDLLFTQAVSLSASPCAPPLDRMAVTAYDQS